MSIYDFSSHVQLSLNEEGDGATTMDAISFLPSQVGVVRAALNKLKKHKSTWNLEIQEGESENEVRVEDRLSIKIPKEHWPAFQDMFEGDIADKSQLVFQTILSDSEIEETEGPIEERKDEIYTKIFELVESSSVQLALKQLQHWISRFGIIKDKTFESENPPLLGILNLEENAIALHSQLVEGADDDLGQLEILLGKLNEDIYHCCQGKDSLAGCRIESWFQGVGLIFESRVDLQGQVFFSVLVEDIESADRLEESALGVFREGNVFYPTLGQLTTPDGLFDILYQTLSGD